ncbi:hypothetical protein CHS0354_034557 [Potamilus streckersoni]|uniref:glutamate carboxypeptidase II n=1 Tax=Potamilus streckersoni TaxID=2493646 RepID=A0AAE0SUV8_9BIVA|nr:hypothetical protein CHS0354_034557 [Potamilus streckersoni]
MYSKKSAANRRCICAVFLLTAAIGIGIGIAIGRLAMCPGRKEEPKADGIFLPGITEALIKDGDPAIGDELIRAISSENIEKYLRNLTEEPHLAGTLADEKQAKELRDFWLNVGLDHVTITPYRVLLSYPQVGDPNFVELLTTNGTVLYKSSLTEKIINPEENKTGVVPPFNAFSAPGDVKGDLVYVNYGRVEDYDYLQKNRSINVSGKVVIARYGKIFRGDKVHLAEKHGAKGIIIFSDPADYTDLNNSRVYDEDWWLPGSGAQRGTVYIGDGDPLTPDYPAIETAYRFAENASNLEFYLPKIPAHPIGYDIARHIMEALDGEEVPHNWKGGLNVTYKFGGFGASNRTIRIKISTRNKEVMTYNTIGILRGQIEPDRYVILGNHRDAWVFGAIDPSSGTAVMMEIARAMGQIKKTKNWRPRRSILFCSWGAEEYGLIGSTEWIEQYAKSLGARVVGYLNVDNAVKGNATLRGEGTPLLFHITYEAAKRVPNPNETEISLGRKTVYDTWMHYLPNEDKDRPIIDLPGSGSDYASFRDRIGVPIVDICYTYDRKRFHISSYPLYHSVYETFYAVKHLMDQEFKYHTAVGQIWAEMARNLADTVIIPFNVSDYSRTLQELTQTLLKDYNKTLLANGINTHLLVIAVQNFSTEVENFQHSLITVNKNDPLAVRMINDQLMNLDRAFLDPAGLPGRRLKRHILLAQSSVNTYAGSIFPGLIDGLFEIDKAANKTEKWEIVKHHYSVILFTIQSAASTLRDVTHFMYSY